MAPRMAVGTARAAAAMPSSSRPYSENGLTFFGVVGNEVFVDNVKSLYAYFEGEYSALFPIVVAVAAVVVAVRYREFNFGSGESIGRSGKLFKVKGRRFLSPFCKMNRKNCLADIAFRQVNKKNLIETAFANQFRRQRGNIVRCGNDKHPAFFLCHPCQKTPQDALRRSCFTTVARQAFFDLVNPQDTGLHGIGGAE